MGETGSARCKCQSGVEEVLIFTVTSSNPERTRYGGVPGQTQPVNIGWGDSRGVCLLYDGWKKKQTHFQPKQDSGVCGPAAEEMDPGGFRSSSAGAERTQGLFQKWHKSGMHIHTMCSLPGKRQSSLWKNTVTGALKPRTLRDCRDTVALKSDRPGGNTPHNIQKAEAFLGQNGSVQENTPKDWL